MSDQEKTKRGTPHAAAWTEEWCVLVAAREEKLDHRICGAVGMDGTPCPRSSEHASGRCTHHGGNPFVGGALGNENARRHGLYARRLKACDGACPQWEGCPYASADILELPAGQRPRCVYETLEYEAVVASYLPSEAAEDADVAGAGGDSEPSVWDMPTPQTAAGVNPYLVHTLALLQVMVSRAATALSGGDLCETVAATGEHYKMESTRVSAALEAFLRLSREYRQLSREVARVVEAQPEVKPVGIATMLKPLMKKGGNIMQEHMREQYAEDMARREALAVERDRQRRAREPVTITDEEIDPNGAPIRPSVIRAGGGP